MNDFGRVVACGSISGYDVPPEQRFGVRNLFHVVAKSITYRGFVSAPAPLLASSFPPKQEAAAQITNKDNFPARAAPSLPPFVVLCLTLLLGQDPAFEEGRAQLLAWLKSGEMRELVTFREGFEQVPAALLGLFAGENTGKMLVRVPLPA